MGSSETQASDIYTSLQRGDSQTQARVWSDYYLLIIRTAKQKLGGFPCRAFDEEDIALAVLHDFFNAVRLGKIYRWNDVMELRCLLRAMTHNMVSVFRRREMRAKRGGGNVRGNSVFMARSTEDEQQVGKQFEPMDEHTSPPSAAVREEDQRRLLEALPDDFMREIVRLRLLDYTNNEIALTLGCARRTVERKLQRIRALLSRAGEQLVSIV